MKYINQLQEEVKKLKNDKKELKKEIRTLESILSLVMYAESSVPSEFYLPVLEKYKSLQRHVKVMYGAYIILAIATTLMIINFYMVV